MKLNEYRTLFNAMADETRLRILSLLGEGEFCVCDLVKVLKEPQSKISRHLAYLRRSSLVSARKDGLWVYYRLSKPASRALGAMIDAFSRCRCDCGELAKDRSEFQRTRKNLVACC